MKYVSSLTPKLIYIMRINDKAHAGCLKIGDTTLDEEISASELQPNCSALNKAARKRINFYTQTAGIAYDLLYTEYTLYIKGKNVCSFQDHDVHEVLKRSGIKKKVFDIKAKADEWYITDLATAKKAIAAVKAGKKSLNSSDITTGQSPVIFRPEQQEAIDKTIKQFAKNDRMLWNAKMRFGKTLTALQVVKEKEEFIRTLILTHRPVVNAGWFEDFHKIFYDRKDFAFGSKKKGESFATLEQEARKHHIRYVYFASMQDLRGSEKAGGKFNKNDEIFDAKWDLIIVDEAHEGTQTELGKNVMAELEKKHTRVLRLSGTPFNLLDDYKEEEIYTWDYVMEQKAKADWYKNHYGDPNPYESLPRLNIFTFDLGKMLSQFRDEDLAFNFHEFFRVDENGSFIHEKEVRYFLNLICKPDAESNYPYSTEEYRQNFRHSLWMVPGVKEAKALSAMLKAHKVFGQFQIVNVAGDGDEDEENEESLKKVLSAIGENPEETYTITLSCGRLTTGVSVPAWTAVFMLSGSFNTSAASYMQTIFRVQTPATINGRIKTECFVFDFAPDRTLKVLAETAKISTKAGKTSGDDRQVMGEFLNFCPVIAVDGTRMKNYDVNHMLEQLKKVYVERVVRRGFEDNYLYNNDLLMQLTGEDLSDFDDLKKIIGTTKAMDKTGDIDVNNQGFTKEEYEKLEKIEKKPKKELTKAELKLLEEKKKKKNQRDTAISILRGISIRMPLMIYGAELKESKEITIDNFCSLIDQQSWEEFMPRGVSKQKFNAFKKYYEPDVFRAAGKQIRAMAKSADSEPLEERIALITNIFNTFHNPDKETVLTPWRVVNMHISDCIGGYCFFNEAFDQTLSKPEFVDNGKVTADVFKPDSRILEINSKTGLYPLYMAYSIYRTRLDAINTLGFSMEPTVEQQYELWDKTVAENIFVICKTPMAKSITKRTLMGFRKGKVNAHYFEDLINTLKNKQQQFVSKVNRGNYWGLKGIDEMKFDAIVGNPPYQVMDGGNKSSATAVYNDFVTQAKKINTNYISMIIPARWYSGGKGLDLFRNEMLSDRHIESIVDYADSRECFPTVDIAGGICYFLWNSQYNGKCRFVNINQGIETASEKYLNEYDTLLRYPVAETIIKKVQTEEQRLSEFVSSRKPFGIDTAIQPLKTGDIKIRYSGGTGFYSSTKISVGKKMIDSWKVIISYLTAEHAGQPDKNGQFRVLSTMEVLPPKTICSETYLVVGSFLVKNEAENLYSYLQTRFVRFLLAQIAVSQHITKSCFSFVPVQDFTKKSDIDWTRPIPEIDAQLYKKYGLTKEEVAFIESMIKPME